MIELYKMINHIDKIDFEKLFTFSNDNYSLRKHNYHLKIKHHVKKNSTLNFFTRRVINYWNNLQYDIVNSASLNIFKNRLDKFMAADDSIY